MELKKKTFVRKRMFFSDNLCLSLQFRKNGLLLGKLVHFPDTLKMTKSFSGLYHVEAQSVKVVFIVDWTLADRSGAVLTCFSGQIVKHDDCFECLILKWLQINETYTDIGSFVQQEVEILVNSPCKDVSAEAKKIIPILLKNAFH